MRSISALALVVALFPSAALADVTTSRTVLYIAQAADSAQSGVLVDGIRIDRELDPLALPFSHGGPATFALGCALADIVSGALERRWPVHLKEAAIDLQASAHGAAFVYTWKGIHL